MFGWVDDHHTLEVPVGLPSLGLGAVTLAGEKTLPESGGVWSRYIADKRQAWSLWLDERGMVVRARMVQTTLPPTCTGCRARFNTHVDIYKHCLGCMCKRR